MGFRESTKKKLIFRASKAYQLICFRMKQKNLSMLLKPFLPFPRCLINTARAEKTSAIQFQSETFLVCCSWNLFSWRRTERKGGRNRRRHKYAFAMFRYVLVTSSLLSPLRQRWGQKKGGGWRRALIKNERGGRKGLICWGVFAACKMKHKNTCMCSLYRYNLKTSQLAFSNEWRMVLVQFR